MPTSHYTARARLAALLRHRPGDTAAVDAARADLRRIRAAEYVTELIASAPPISAADRLHLCGLLADPRPVSVAETELTLLERAPGGAA